MTEITGCVLMLLFLVFSSFCAKAQERDSYNISGKIEGVQNEMIYLSNKPMGTNDGFKVVVHDSVFSTDGRFVFNKEYRSTDFFSIEVPSQHSQWLPFLTPIDPANPVEITAKVDQLYLGEVKGSRAHDDFMSLRKLIRKEFSEPAVALYEKRDSISDYEDSLAVINKALGEFLIAESNRSPDSYGVLLETNGSSPVLSKDTIKKNL